MAFGQAKMTQGELDTYVIMGRVTPLYGPHCTWLTTGPSLLTMVKLTAHGSGSPSKHTPPQHVLLLLAVDNSSQCMQ